ncbi:hypothetical protein Gotur_035652 [Gossypium turneri]
MSRRVRQKREHSWGEKTNISSETLDCGSLASATISGVDWTTLPDDTNYNLVEPDSSQQSFLWDRLMLDQRFSMANPTPFCLLGSPTSDASVIIRPAYWGHWTSVLTDLTLELQFHSPHDARISRDLNFIGDFCWDITDAALSVIAARHEMLESVHFGPDACERISSDAIKALAYCCLRLRRLWMSSVKEINGDAINALAEHCRKFVGVLDSKQNCFALLEQQASWLGEETK